MKNFRESLEHVLSHEGGWSNHPADPGGATNRGITLATYREHTGNGMLSPEDLRKITDAEVEEIYRDRYWDPIRGNQLPAGLDLVTFDMAVNAGPKRAARILQATVRATVDGIIGPKTLEAAHFVDSEEAVNEYEDRRISFYRRLWHWKFFGRGWKRRAKAATANACRLIRKNRDSPGQCGEDTTNGS